MLSIKFLILAFMVLPMINADFGQFLDDHRQQVNILFQDTNKNLTDVRNEFHNFLSALNDIATQRHISLYNMLRSREDTAHQRMDQVTNSTCIQNLRNILADAISLAGFRLSICSSQFYPKSVALSNVFYQQIDNQQLRAINLPFMFMAGLQGENVLNDETSVVGKIEGGLVNERNILKQKFAEIYVRGFIDATLLVYEEFTACFDSTEFNFRSVAESLEQRITTICGQV